MFAYIKILGTNELKIVNVNEIQKFKVDALPTKKFNIKIGHKTEQCTPVSFKAETEEELLKLIESNRARFPPASICVTASEDDAQVDKVNKSPDHQKTNTQALLDKKLALKNKNLLLIKSVFGDKVHSKEDEPLGDE
ncbi:hypothetical protein RN001_005713 [Aquatica leii]|uniref:Uncharacterized protein n=1 Tax=Aquatica leii TaxID=1421715 RepID=A0AAN7Q0N8_9COLE|nr:hypothetical protein RN001_005713 [Aquatica leii]